MVSGKYKDRYYSGIQVSNLYQKFQTQVLSEESLHGKFRNRQGDMYLLIRLFVVALFIIAKFGESPKWP